MKAGRPCLVEEGKLIPLIYKGPKSLKGKIEEKVKSLRLAGFDVSFSSLHRAIIENSIEHAERFLKKTC